MRKKIFEWEYKDKNGQLLGKVIRFDNSVFDDNHKTNKEIVPYFNKNWQGKLTAGIPDEVKSSRPLYGLETIKEDSDTVFIVEGEKCAHALRSAFGYTVVTSLGGAKSASQADWSPLANFKNYFIIPDNDHSGMEYAKTVYNHLKRLNQNGFYSLINLENLPNKGDICDWFEENGFKPYWNGFQTVKKTVPETVINGLRSRFMELITCQYGNIPPEWNIKKGSKGLMCINIEDMLNMDIPERKNILSPWLTEQSLNMIYADRGVGKTYFALNCAYAIATGGEFLKYKATDKNTVIYLDGEMQAPIIIDRLRQIAGSKDIQNVPIHFVTPDIQPDRPLPDLSSLEGQSEIDEMIESVNAKVIFVDNLSTLCRTGRENEGESWLLVQTWAIRHRAQGRTVVFIHHANKGGDQRGTSRKEDVLDNVIRLQRPDDYDNGESGACFEVDFTKSRSLFGEDTKTIVAELVSEKNTSFWKWEYMSSNMEKCISMMQAGMKQSDIAEELGVNKSTITRMKMKAKAEGIRI